MPVIAVPTSKNKARRLEHSTCQYRSNQQDAGDKDVGGQDAEPIHHGTHAQCHHDAKQLTRRERKSMNQINQTLYQVWSDNIKWNHKGFFLVCVCINVPVNKMWEYMTQKA